MLNMSEFCSVINFVYSGHYDGIDKLFFTVSIIAFSLTSLKRSAF